MAGRTRLRALAMLIGLALLAALSAVPARAIEPYPGETQEAFAARARLDQQAKLAAADEASAGPLKSLSADSGGSALGGALKIGTISLVMLVLGGLRMSRGIFRASQSIAKAGGVSRKNESFEDRLAKKLRELEQSNPRPVEPAVHAEPAAPPNVPRPLATGPRTFGRRVS